jgi:hypothetical protein
MTSPLDAPPSPVALDPETTFSAIHSSLHPRAATVFYNRLDAARVGNAASTKKHADRYP